MYQGSKTLYRDSNESFIYNMMTPIIEDSWKVGLNYMSWENYRWMSIGTHSFFHDQ